MRSRGSSCGGLATVWHRDNFTMRCSRRPGLEEQSSEESMDLGAKKTVLRQFTYGLYAVTATYDGDRGVFTANWLSQVSFEPPLVALSVELDSSTLALIRASGRFTICPLVEGQKELAGGLGRPRSKSGDKFETMNLAVTTTEQGDLALRDSLGYVTCAVRSES